MTNKTELVSTNEIQKGDTVIIDGNMVTVGKETIRNDVFFGTLINGRPFTETGRKIERVLFRKWYKGEIIGWYAQV